MGLRVRDLERKEDERDKEEHEAGHMVDERIEPR